jgi:hypothetical protein
MDVTPEIPDEALAQEPDEKPRGSSKWVWQGKLGPAFWTVASLLSLSINVILIVLLILLGKQLFPLKDLLSQQLLGGLYYNFVQMDQAQIKTDVRVKDTIHVSDTIEVVFDLPLAQDTRVILTQNTPINQATIFLNGQAVPINIVLPAGTPLDIRLNMTVPVSQTVPVELDVPVNLNVPVVIPLDETELHDPFIGLQEVVSPYYWQIVKLPDSWTELLLCAPGIERLCPQTDVEALP